MTRLPFSFSKKFRLTRSHAGTPSSRILSFQFDGTFERKILFAVISCLVFSSCLDTVFTSGSTKQKEKKLVESPQNPKNQDEDEKEASSRGNIPEDTPSGENAEVKDTPHAELSVKNNIETSSPVKPLEKSKDEATIINTTKAVEAVCGSGATKTITKTLDYPARLGCSWGMNGNLYPGHGICARETQTATAQLPSGAILCGFDLKSITPSIRYDDSIVLTIENFVILASDRIHTADLERKANTLLWDFQRVLHKDFGTDDHYCLVKMCVVPKMDQNGVFDISITSQEASGIALELKDKNTFNFDFITMGDDNPESDCGHSGISFNLTLSYVIPR